MENNETTNTNLELVQIGNDRFYKISNSDSLRAFFMSIVSDSDHWMFISSNGGLTAGRKNSEYSLFPYYTDDKITELADVTGSKSIFRVQKNGETHIWEPFSERFEGRYNITRNLYKNEYGNKVLFEEENHDLKLSFQYQWNSSEGYGFVRKSKLTNHAEAAVKVEILDGIQNIIPYGIPSDLQNSFSNLVDAYKRSELEQETGLGIFALSAIIVDRAEPSEALKANIAWSLGLDNPKHLLSSLQLKDYRKGKALRGEEDVKAEKGAYFVNKTIELAAGNAKDWMIVAEVNQNHATISKISNAIKSDESLAEAVNKDIEAGTKRLIKLNASSDGLQFTSDNLRDSRHFSNTLFNIMRGGIFDDNYQIEKSDFSKYLAKANKKVAKKFVNQVQNLSETFTLSQLRNIANQSDDANFKRLCFEYLPLKFSRRHGDPSRPWNKFSINTRSEDGSKILDYQGNWRDIFQNWEALAHAYPDFMESMIHKFLNATTFDGYNPYRVTKDGFDWEAIEADDPWSYIGYWGDHQIIYLLKFLEFIEKHQPGKLSELFSQELFVYANVPYKIKSYSDIIKNSKDTIDFDHELDHEVRRRRDEIGADGALIQDRSGGVYQVNFIEKILATTLAKLSNFIMEGGIWMNTQRPEWNDANNALVGNGVSMVTLYYLRRFLNFFKDLLANIEEDGVEVSNEMLEFFKSIHGVFNQNQELLAKKVNDEERKAVLDGLGQAGDKFRTEIYENGFAGSKSTLTFNDLRAFIDSGLAYLEHSIRANKRTDNLYHAYNLMTVENDKDVSVSYLSEMLEGQVAVLSSGYLSSEEALSVLDAMKKSALFRPDQYSYILYPNKRLPGFLEKNIIPNASVENSELLTKLEQDGDIQIIEKDVNGVYHFNGNFKNADDLASALDSLSSKYSESLEKEKNKVLQTFEEVFNHKAFTGRSGTFYGYEGLGSIYWHMVSKLLLAAQECCLKAIQEGESAETIGRLLEHYYEINAGIGVHKPPSLYGAFPTDPYSHTPGGKGAQQPGMTGQVKEDVLCRFGELGVFVKEGQLFFNPCLLRKNEFLSERKTIEYVNVNLEKQTLDLEANSLAFTYCQVPVIYKIGSENSLEVVFGNGKSENSDASKLNLETSRKVFERSGEVEKIVVSIKESELR